MAACYCSAACHRADAARHSLVCAALAAAPRYSEAEMAVRAPATRALREAAAVRTSDGDTLAVRFVGSDDGGDSDVEGVESVRFDGVDAPELKQPLGRRAAAFIATLAPPGAVMRVAVKPGGGGRDKYRRLVADLWVQLCASGATPGQRATPARWVWLQEALLVGGLAHRFSDYDSGRAPVPELERGRALDAAAERGRAGERNLWAPEAPAPPMLPKAWRRATSAQRRAERRRWPAAAR